MPNSKSSCYVGLMSGTSMDGIDAALVSFSKPGAVELIDCIHLAYSEHLRQQLDELVQPSWTGPLATVATLDVMVGTEFAKASNILIQRNPERTVAAIGSHGQTIHHSPEAPHASTWQIGDPNLIAELTNRPVIADFRRRDIAGGGQGAPLAPGFHEYLFGQSTATLINLGGIANITILGTDEPIGYDTGPANTLMDLWVRQHENQAFDNNGAWAQQGQVNKELLSAMQEDPFFSLPAPKSTGREHFHLDWLNTVLDSLSTPCPPIDVQRTLCELTATTVANAIRTHPLQQQGSIYLCGGGARNTFLVQRLQDNLPEHTINSIASKKIDPDYLEAMAFAWLARQTFNQQPGNLPSVTGAKGRRVLGALYSA